MEFRNCIAKLCLFLAVLPFHAFSQNHPLKKGAYRNCIDFNSNNPFIESGFFIKKIYSSKVPELYIVKPHDPRVKKKIIEKVIWGIYDGNDFYLNAEKMGMKFGYIRIEKLGKYSYFRGIPIKSLNQEEMIKKNLLAYGLVGSAITIEAIEYKNRNNVHYVLSSKTGNINLLTKEFIAMILRPYPDLLLSFQQENINDNLEVLFKYLDLVNSTP
ncbi:MAG: DUF6563 family protein [Bacteroidales bacterium]